jgi:predicted dehydrogenase
MLKVAIVGCGKIADAHASQIQRIPGCEIVGVCDREMLMAEQLHERFPVKRCFIDLSELITEAQPDVVHITTPPESHFVIARFCLEHGRHVYVEKPFTLNAEEADQLVSLATEKRLKLTVGHNNQFSHVARRLRELVDAGYLGGTPIHMESYYGYDLSDPSYARALLADSRHWVRRLPGQLLQNIISHGIARIAEFLSSDNPQVIAQGFVSPVLKRIGETSIVDELRVIIRDEDRTTAYFTFSSQMRPALHEFRVYGPKNGLFLDQNHEIVLRLRGAKFKSYADHFIPPVLFAKEHLKNLFENVRLFLRRDFQMDAGMKYLIETFYRSIRGEAPLPIPYRKIVLTARIMDAIFDQLRSTRSIGDCDDRMDSVALATMPARHGEPHRTNAPKESSNAIG